MELCGVKYAETETHVILFSIKQYTKQQKKAKDEATQEGGSTISRLDYAMVRGAEGRISSFKFSYIHAKESLPCPFSRSL